MKAKKTSAGARGARSGAGGNRKARPAAGNGESARLRAQRLKPEDRQRVIVQEATRFFAHNGFAGNTRALAEKIGVTQALLYKYFSSKEELVERVFDAILLEKWNDYWEILLASQQIPLRDRLVRFYVEYEQSILSYDMIRIMMYAGLADRPITRLVELVETRVVLPIGRALREHIGLSSDIAEQPLTAEERNLIWGLQGSVFYIGIRKHVYGAELQEDSKLLVSDLVDSFLQGATAVIRRIHSGQAGSSRKSKAGAAT